MVFVSHQFNPLRLLRGRDYWEVGARLEGWTLDAFNSRASYMRQQAGFYVEDLEPFVGVLICWRDGVMSQGNFVWTFDLSPFEFKP